MRLKFLFIVIVLCSDDPKNGQIRVIWRTLNTACWSVSNSRNYVRPQYVATRGCYLVIGEVKLHPNKLHPNKRTSSPTLIIWIRAQFTTFPNIFWKSWGRLSFVDQIKSSRLYVDETRLELVMLAGSPSSWRKISVNWAIHLSFDPLLTISTNHLNTRL
jgi:hypothetical protein